MVGVEQGPAPGEVAAEAVEVVVGPRTQPRLRKPQQLTTDPR